MKDFVSIFFFRDFGSSPHHYLLNSRASNVHIKVDFKVTVKVEVKS